MSNDQNPKRPKSWMLLAFLAGVGIVFGLSTHQFWDGKGPNQLQISAAFWGLIGGVIGMAVWVIFRLTKR